MSAYSETSSSTVNSVFQNINAKLVQLKKLVKSQIREAISLRDDPSSLNDSVSNLSMCLQEHKQQTTAELAQLQASLNTTQSSLTQQVNAKLSTLTTNLSQHQQQTASSLETAISKLDLLTCTTAQLSTDHQQILPNISDVECVDTEWSL